MPNVLAKIGAERARGQPVRGTRRRIGDGRRPRRAASRAIGDLVRTSGSDLGFVFDPDGETATIIDDKGTSLDPEQALLALVTLVARGVPGARIALPVVGEPRGRAHRRASTAPRSPGRSSRPRTSWRSRRRAVDFAASQEGGFIWPDVPARVRRGRDARAPPRPARGDRPRRCRRSSPALPEIARRARDGADAVGAQGRGDARDGRAGEGRATSCSSTA